MEVRETVVAAVVVVGATVAVALHAIDSTAYVGIIGAATGYSGRAIVGKVKGTNQ